MDTLGRTWIRLVECVYHNCHNTFKAARWPPVVQGFDGHTRWIRYYKVKPSPRGTLISLYWWKALINLEVLAHKWQYVSDHNVYMRRWWRIACVPYQGHIMARSQCRLMLWPSRKPISIVSEVLLTPLSLIRFYSMQCPRSNTPWYIFCF